MKRLLVCVIAGVLWVGSVPAGASVTSLWSGSLSATSVEDWSWCKVGYAGGTLLESVNGQAGTTTITGTVQFTSVPGATYGAFLQIGLITQAEYLRAENPAALGGDFAGLSVNPWAKNNHGAGIMLAEGQWYSGDHGFAYDYSGSINGGAGYLSGGVMTTVGGQEGFHVGSAGASLPFTIVLTPGVGAGGTMDVFVDGTLIADDFAYGQDNWKKEGVDSKYWLDPEDFAQSYLVANLFTMTGNMGDVVTVDFGDVQATFAAPVPVPGAALLALLGAGVVGAARRRFA